MNFFDSLSALPFPGTLHSTDRTQGDAELIKRFLAGDKHHFSLLVERHMTMVYRFAYRYVGTVDDASDIAQETFIRAWKHLDSFDTNRNFKTWILAIAKNASLDFIKKKKPILFSQIESADVDLDVALAPYVESTETPDALFEKKSEAALLESALQKLPPQYQVVLNLRYREHLKFREIAEILGEPIDTVKSKHRRGMVLLKKYFPGASV